MVCATTDDTIDRFGGGAADIRCVTGSEGLDHYRIVVEDVRGESCQTDMDRYRRELEDNPDNLSIYVAYVDGEPAACGRVYLPDGGRFAALYGGQTRPRFRKRGLFTQLVAVRMREALSRGIPNVCVDALPTSEPIFAKCGFEKWTYTQPFYFSP